MSDVSFLVYFQKMYAIVKGSLAGCVQAGQFVRLHARVHAQLPGQVQWADAVMTPHLCYMWAVMLCTQGVHTKGLVARLAQQCLASSSSMDASCPEGLLHRLTVHNAENDWSGIWLTSWGVMLCRFPWTDIVNTLTLSTSTSSNLIEVSKVSFADPS